MGEKYIITRLKNRIVSGIYENNRFAELNVINEEVSKLNNICVGRVENVVKNINCAFVEIEKDVNCFYSLDDNHSPIFLNRKNSDKVCQGDLMLVQVMKEAVKTKPPTVTCEISITGKYTVLARNASSVFISNKINNKDRIQELKSILKPLLLTEEEKECKDSLSASFGFIVRTNAESADNADILREANNLKNQYMNIMKTAMYRTAFTLMYTGEPEYVEDIKNLKTSALDCIITDHKDIYETIEKYFLDNSPTDLGKLEFYEDALLPLNKLYSMESAINSALNKKVWLKSGGYLVIEPTEALLVIDVNTGKFSAGKKGKEESFLKINLEAAAEIKRQIRLRNISGIIIIDFINMERREHMVFLQKELGKLVKDDTVTTQVIGMTKLGLMEITRKKIRKPLYELCNDWRSDL